MRRSSGPVRARPLDDLGRSQELGARESTETKAADGEGPAAESQRDAQGEEERFVELRPNRRRVPEADYDAAWQRLTTKVARRRNVLSEARSDEGKCATRGQELPLAAFSFSDYTQAVYDKLEVDAASLEEQLAQARADASARRQEARISNPQMFMRVQGEDVVQLKQASSAKMDRAIERYIRAAQLARYRSRQQARDTPLTSS